jgi:hypothetical protein
MVELAAGQKRCVSIAQLHDLGFGKNAIAHRLANGRLITLHDGVFAIPPVPDDDWQVRWMAATLTGPRTFISHAAAGFAHGCWSPIPQYPIVTRPGSGGPQLLDGVLVCRSRELGGETTRLEGIPITTPERTVVDLAAFARGRRLERVVREAIRLRTTTAVELHAATRRHRGRRGVARLRAAVGRYAGLSLERTRSDAEALALTILRDAGRPVDDHNRLIEGEEADLIWHRHRLIIEIDGPQFHLDAAENLRKQRIWEAGGWTVLRISSDDVYLHPHRLIAPAPAPTPNVRQPPL